MPRRSPPVRQSAQAAAIGAVLLLAGCQYASSPLVGFGGFIGDTHTLRSNPNRVAGGDENVLYSEGRNVAQTPLLPEPGNVWPGPPPPIPTLTDVEKLQNEQPIPEQPPPTPAPPPRRPITHGSSTPPGAVQTTPATPPAPPPAEFSPLAPQPGPTSPPVITTPSGPLINNGPVGAPGGASTATNPAGGGTSIIVPNGNGTSTVIAPDGSTTTIPTPK